LIEHGLMSRQHSVGYMGKEKRYRRKPRKAKKHKIVVLCEYSKFRIELLLQYSIRNKYNYSKFSILTITNFLLKTA